MPSTGWWLTAHCSWQKPATKSLAHSSQPGTGGAGTMYRLAVHPNRRREKIALALIRSGEQRLQDRGCVRVTALVPHEDEAPRALWKAAGYGHDRQIQRFVKNL